MTTARFSGHSSGPSRARSRPDDANNSLNVAQWLEMPGLMVYLEKVHNPIGPRMTDSALPSDENLTESGYVDGNRQGQILLIACGALAHEILALKKANGWDHMHLQCLPAKYHLYPEKITDAVEQAVLGRRDAFENIFVVYADCGTGGLLEAKCRELGVEMIAGPHCYSFFEGNDSFAARGDDDMTAFFLTDFLVKQFDAFVWKPMGLDKHPQLRDMIFGNYTKLVYQAQIRDEALAAKARDCADRLGLRYEYRYTGYGDLEKSLQDQAARP